MRLITGTAGVITIIRGHGRISDQPPVMRYAGGKSEGCAFADAERQRQHDHGKVLGLEAQGLDREVRPQHA